MSHFQTVTVFLVSYTKASLLQIIIVVATKMCELTCSLMMAVLNSVGVNVTATSTLPLAGTIPVNRVGTCQPILSAARSQMDTKDGIQVLCSWFYSQLFNRLHSHKGITINNYVNCPSNFCILPIRFVYFTHLFLRKSFVRNRIRSISTRPIIVPNGY